MFKYTPQLFPRADQVVLPKQYATTTRYYDRRSGSMLWPVFHRECGEVAFFMTKAPQAVDNIKAHMVFDRDGKHPEPHSPMICGSCNEGIRKHELLAEPPPRQKVIIDLGG